MYIPHFFKLFLFKMCNNSYIFKTGLSYTVLFKSSTFQWCRLYHAAGNSAIGESFVLTEEQQKQKHRLKGLPIVHHHGYVCELPPGHRFPMAKFHKVYDYLIKDGIISHAQQVVEASKVPVDVACTVHTPDYITKFFHGKTSASDQRATGFLWTPELVSRARYETGGTLLASLLCLERGLACSTAGGTHHAFPDRGAGFCLINDLAVSAQYLVNIRKVSKVLIIDLDVHQGDGTAYIFSNNPSVFTFSMHCEHNFPFRKQKSDLDIVLQNGTDDTTYLSILYDTLPTILSTFRPDLVLYDAGVDPHFEDELGKLSLTDEGLSRRDEYVLETVLKQGTPVATVIGGGYSIDTEKLSIRHSIIHRVATKVWKHRNL